LSASDSALIASLPTLLDGVEASVTWEHAPLARWLIGTKSFWFLAGRGRTFDEVRRLVPRTGGSYELCLSATARADLLVLDGTFRPEEEDPAYWAARIAPGAVVVVAGIHPAGGASELWRRWSETSPAPATFRAAAGNGLGLLLPDPELAPPAIRELLTSGSATTALFDAAALAARQIAEAVRDADTARALAHRLNTLHMQQRELEVDAHNLRVSLVHEQARGDGLAQHIAVLNSSTTYRVAMVLGRLGTLLPPVLRRRLRQAAKLAWWTLRGRLVTALRARKALLEAAGKHDSAQDKGVEPPEPGQPGQVNVGVAPTWVPAAAISGTPFGAGLSGRPLMRVAIGYAVADANLPRLTRAVDRARRALAAIGQQQAGCILVTDDGAAVSLQHWVPADVVVLPRRGPGGFPAAHARMMEVAFAQGADAYVLTETRSRFNETTLAASLSALAAYGSEGVVAVGADLDPLMDAVSPAFIVITRGAAAQLGPIDVQLDAPCGLLDLYMRAEMLGINVLRLKGQALSFDMNKAEMLAAWRLGRYALDAAWVLAGKWDCEPMTAQIRSAYVARGIVPPPAVANEHSGRDVMLVGWWERRMANWPRGNGAQLEPMADQEAVLPPAELDASLAVPFGAVDLPWTEVDQRVAAIVHLCGDGLGQQTFDTLKHIPGRCDLFITTDTDAYREAIAALFDGWTAGAVDVRVHPNRGGHVGPMLEVLREIISSYDILLHLHGNPTQPHGKESSSRDRRPEWRSYLYQTLCGSDDIVASVFTAFAASPRLGIVFPQHWRAVKAAISWGNSFDDAQDLASRIGTDLHLRQPLEFPTGFMFWARTAALAPLLSFDLTAADFVDGEEAGTFAQAVERLLLHACEHTGHTWIKIARTDPGDDLPSPLTAQSPDRLNEQLRCITYLLTDPVLWEAGRTSSPWRLRPDDNELPRLTLIAAADWSRELWARCEDVMRARLPQLEIRIQIVPSFADNIGVPSPIDVRAEEIFVATDEGCAQVALQLVQLQHRFFGRSEPVQMLERWSEDQLQSKPVRAGGITHDLELATWPQERPA
jgi:hypothetical protein